MDNKQTKSLDLNLLLLLIEGLRWVDALTPTEINMGGCGLFAEELSKRLDSIGVENKVWALYFDKEYNEHGYSHTNNFVNGDRKELKNVAVDHMCVQIGDFWFDSTGCINVAIETIEKMVEIPKELIHTFVHDSHNWNHTFDTDCIPCIEEHLDQMFKLVDNYKSHMLNVCEAKEVKYTDHTIREKRKNNPLEGLLSLESLFQ